MLLGELHHRVTNNLQLVSSRLSLEAAAARREPPATLGLTLVRWLVEQLGGDLRTDVKAGDDVPHRLPLGAGVFG